MVVSCLPSWRFVHIAMTSPGRHYPITGIRGNALAFGLNFMVFSASCHRVCPNARALPPNSQTWWYHSWVISACWRGTRNAPKFSIWGWNSPPPLTSWPAVGKHPIKSGDLHPQQGCGIPDIDPHPIPFSRWKSNLWIYYHSVKRCTCRSIYTNSLSRRNFPQCKLGRSM